MSAQPVRTNRDGVVSGPTPLSSGNGRSLSQVIQIGKQLAECSLTVGHAPGEMSIAKKLFEVQDLKSWYLRMIKEAGLKPPFPSGSTPDETWKFSRNVYTESGDGASVWLHPANFSAVIIRIVGKSIKEETLKNVLLTLIQKMSQIIQDTVGGGNAALYVMTPIGLVLKRPEATYASAANGNDEFSIANVIMGAGLMPYGMVNRHYSPTSVGFPDRVIEGRDANAELLYTKWVPGSTLETYKESMIPEYATSSTGGHCFVFTSFTKEKVEAAEASNKPLGVLLMYPLHGKSLATPGGAGDLGESIMETTIRECHEELGIALKVDRPWYHLDSYTKRYGGVGAQQWVAGGIGDQHHTFATLVTEYKDVWKGANFNLKGTATDSLFVGLFDVEKLIKRYVTYINHADRTSINIQACLLGGSDANFDKTLSINKEKLEEIVRAALQIANGAAPRLSFKDSKTESVKWNSDSSGLLDAFKAKYTGRDVKTLDFDKLTATA